MATRAQKLTTELAMLQDLCGSQAQWVLVKNISNQLDETHNSVNLIQCELDSIQGLC